MEAKLHRRKVNHRTNERNKMNKSRLKPADIEAGKRLDVIRKSQNPKMSQTKLGDAVGVTYQQIQKYLSGANKLSVGRILQMCEALNCHPMDIIPYEGKADFSADRLKELEGLRALKDGIVKLVRVK